MKNLSFRGKRIDNGEWVEGGSIIRQIIHEGLTIEHNIYIANAGEEFTAIHDTETGNMLSIEQGTFYAVDPETVGQWTGLTDQNGKRIFDGDIVDILTENEEIGVVEWDDGGYIVSADGFCVDFLHNINGTDVEVIGNIHDNPELLKGE